MTHPNRTQAEDIVRLIDRISASKARFQVPAGAIEQDALSHLQTDARKLMLAVQEPNASFWELVRRCSILSPIKVAQDMGVFRYLLDHESATAKELASISGGEESLIERILRPLIAEGLLDQVGEDAYALTHRGSTFGLEAYSDCTTFAIDFLPIVLSNPAFFRSNGYREPRMHEGLSTPLSCYFGKPDYGFFDYLQDHPDVQQTFMSSMKAQMRSTRLTSSVYPYGEKLQTNFTNGESPVAVVDVGGSRAELVQELKQNHPEIQGRMVVQDRQQTIDSMASKPEGIEIMVHDIFTEQPIKGARAYHLKRILHDWSDDRCRVILGHLVTAMKKEHSILLIMDSVLPTWNASFSQAMSDHSMLTFGGKERSERQWRELLRSVGLCISHIYRGTESEAVIECKIV